MVARRELRVALQARQRLVGAGGRQHEQHAVDAKPKVTPRLQRLANVRAHPRASLLVDHYEEDWDALWWVRVDGPAAVLDDGEEREAALAALIAKYRQYATAAPRGAVIAIAVERWSGWSAR